MQGKGSKMKNKWMKLSSLLLMIVLTVTLLPMNSLTAEAANPAHDRKTGLRDVEFVELTEAQEEEILEQMVEEEDSESVNVSEYKLYQKNKASHGTGAYSQYTSDYIYNRLSAGQKYIYDQLYNGCLEYLTTNKNSDADLPYVMADFSGTGVSIDDAKNVALVFAYLNPQFYFLSDYTYGSRSVGVGIYDAFRDGNQRATASQDFYSRVNSIISNANSAGGTYEKVKKANDIICDQVTYAADEYDQSAYSAICRGQSVCAGYSQAMEVILNGMGIDAIAVTSVEHEWNEVYINGYWYALDTTWIDQDGYYWYEPNFLVSDARICADDDYARECHTPEDFWAQYHRPVCLYDWGSAPNDGGESISTGDSEPVVVPVVESVVDPVVDPVPGEPEPVVGYTGMALWNGIWVYYENGQINWNYTGMACNEAGWWYFTNGQLDWNYTGMACNEAGWWYYQNGQLDWNYTGMACNEYGWWYYRNGQLDWGYTGMASNDYGWWYYRNGQLDWGYTGMASNDYGWWYYTNGQLDLGYTGMASNDYGWWYYQNGQIDWFYTGVGFNECGAWYYVNGTIAWNYSGWVEYFGQWYYVENGHFV